jgi:hypothetical protein
MRRERRAWLTIPSIATSRTVKTRAVGAAKMSQRALIISLQAKTRISLTTVAGQSSMDLMAVRIESMVVETVLCIAFVVAGGTVIVKAYEWHQDVLYGPYMKRTD